MHAIIETGGKQYKVTEGDTLFIEKLASEAGENVTSTRFWLSSTATRSPWALPWWRAPRWTPPW